MTFFESSDPLLEPPLRSDRDLERLWRRLLCPLGFGSRRLWLMMVTADDRPVKQVIEIDDVPVVLEDGTCDGLMETCRLLVTDIVPDGSVALLLSRPGRTPMGRGDVDWARGLVATARSAGVPLQPVYFANDCELRVFPAEDVLLPLVG